MEIYVQLLVNSLQIGAVYVLFSLGLTLIFGVMRILNVAHGSLYAWGGYFAATLGLADCAASISVSGSDAPYRNENAE